MKGAFIHLAEKQKYAIVALSCQVISANNNGILDISKQYDEWSVVFEACFGWNLSFDFYKIRNVIIKTRQYSYIACLNELSQIADGEKKNFIALINRIVGDSGERREMASKIIKGISEPKLSRNDDQGEAPVTEPVFARLTTTAYIKNSSEIFNIRTEYETLSVRCNREYWTSRRLTPRAGLVGFVAKQVQIDEGTLCYLICEADLIIPTLKVGLEVIDQNQYMNKRQNNRILSFFMEEDQ